IDARRHDERTHKAALPPLRAIATRGRVRQRPLTAHDKLVVNHLSREILRVAARRIDLDHELLFRLPDIDRRQPATRPTIGRSPQTERATHLLTDRIQIIQQPICSYTRHASTSINRSIAYSPLPIPAAQRPSTPGRESF